jgi:hypothetical protein
VAVTGVTLPESVGINCGEGASLHAQVLPSNATNKALGWASSDPALAEVSGSGYVKMKATGEATITATAQDGGHAASCTVSTRLGSEERARDAEYERLSGPVKIDKVTYEVKDWNDFNNPSRFMYDPNTHTAYGSDFKLSESVTDPALKEQLAKMLDLQNVACSYSWEHEFRHGANAKYSSTIIKKPENAWKINFLDETSANLAEIMLFRKNMLEEYKKQLDAWVLSGKDPKQFQFSAWGYNITTSGSTSMRTKMILWWDAKNDFADLMTGVSPEEAALLVFHSFDYFEGLFDRAYQYISRE